jgi:hypothetical protein
MCKEPLVIYFEKLEDLKETVKRLSVSGNHSNFRTQDLQNVIQDVGLFLDSTCLKTP